MPLSSRVFNNITITGNSALSQNARLYIGGTGTGHYIGYNAVDDQAQFVGKNNHRAGFNGEGFYVYRNTSTADTDNHVTSDQLIKYTAYYDDNSGIDYSFNVGSITDDDGDGLYFVFPDERFESNDLHGVAVTPQTSTDYSAGCGKGTTRDTIRLWNQAGSQTDGDFHVIATGVLDTSETFI